MKEAPILNALIRLVQPLDIKTKGFGRIIIIFFIMTPKKNFEQNMNEMEPETDRKVLQSWADKIYILHGY